MRILLFFIIFIGSFGEIIAQQGPANDLAEVPVKWYRPEFIKPLDNNRHRIILQGLVKSSVKIYVQETQIPYKREGEKHLDFTTKDEITGAKFATVDSNGLFSIELDLPYGVIQVPLIFKDGKKEVPYLVSIEVREDDLKMTNQGRLEASPFYKKKYGMWLGAGYNYILYKQGSLSFKSFSTPSWYVKVWYEIIPYFDLNISLKSSPGETTSNNNITVNQGSYTWDTFGVEMSYSPESMETQLAGYDVLFGVIGGVQYHRVPYIVQSGVSTANIETNDVMMASLGGRSLFVQSRRWEYEIFLRYQHVVSQGSLFDINSSMVFDGSFGAIYRFKNRDWRLGTFFYGQSFDYESSKFNTITSQQDIIKQSLFFSNIELRLGYEF